MSKPIVSFDERAVKDELQEPFRRTIEETANAMLDEEADQLVGVGSYERTDERAAYRAGHCERGFTTTSGRVTLKMPKLKGMRFATAVIERCRRRETSVEEAVIEMHLAGVSTRRIEDVGEIMWGAGVSASMVGSIAEVFPGTAARCASTATRRPRFPNPSVPGSRPCPRQSTRWNRATRWRQRRNPSPTSPGRWGPRRRRRWFEGASPRR